MPGNDLPYWLENGEQSSASDVQPFVRELEQRLSRMSIPVTDTLSVIDQMMDLFDNIVFQSVIKDVGRQLNGFLGNVLAVEGESTLSRGMSEIIATMDLMPRDYDLEVHPDFEKRVTDEEYARFGSTLENSIKDGFIFYDSIGIDIPANVAALFFVTALRSMGKPARYHFMFSVYNGTDSSQREIYGSGSFFSVYDESFEREHWSDDGWGVFTYAMKNSRSSKKDKYVRKYKEFGAVGENGALLSGVPVVGEEGFTGVLCDKEDYGPFFFVPWEFCDKGMVIEKRGARLVFPRKEDLVNDDAFPDGVPYLVGRDNFQLGVMSYKEFEQVEGVFGQLYMGGSD